MHEIATINTYADVCEAERQAGVKRVPMPMPRVLDEGGQWRHLSNSMAAY